MMSKTIKLFSTLLLLIAAVPAFASHKVTYGPEWTIHSAFEKNVRKIIDSPDITFFFVHQRVYDTKLCGGYYSSPSGAIFYYDKHNPADGIKDLAHAARISGFDMRLVNYNPATKTLVIAYQDGGVDVISSDFNVTYIDDIKKRVMPNATTINSINFDPDNGDIWMGTKAGFAKIDASSLSVVLAPQWSESVSDIVPVGDKVICAIGSKVYHAPKNANLNMRESFVDTKLSVSTTNGIMPLSATTFATIAANGNIYPIYWNNTAWKALSAVASGNNQTSSKIVANSTDHTITPTEKGFYVSSPTKAFSIERPTGDGDRPSVVQITLPESGNIYHASYDLENFWFYNDYRTFVGKSYTKGADGNADKWEKITELVPASPVNAKDNYFLYSPKHGLVMVNHHPMEFTGSYDQYQNAVIATYKDNQWINLTPYCYPPQITQESDAALTKFNSLKNANEWPTSLPCGAIIDPENPDVLFLGSIFQGFVAIYLDDPSKNPFFVNRTNDTAMDPFNAHHFMDPNSWAAFQPVTVLGYDNDHNLWFTFNSCFTQDHVYDLVLYCITPEGRNAQLQSGNGYTSKHMDIKKIVYPGTFQENSWQLGVPLKSKGNETKVFCYRRAGDANGICVSILDHKGTLDDTSDDTLTNIYRVRTPGGVNIANAINHVIENPVTGDIYLSAFHNTYIINLKDPIVDGTIAARTLTFTGEDGLTSDIYPMMRAAFIDFDEYGRIWVPTLDYGLVCLSPDGKQVIASYNSTNSPIGMDDIHSIGWNPDTKSLFVSANDVVCEVKVDLPDVRNSSTDALLPFVTPSAVTPDFKGTVAIHNLPAGLMLRVRNGAGETVANLSAPVNGVAYWNLLDQDGNRIPSGSYTIEDASTHNSITPIVVPVVR